MMTRLVAVGMLVLAGCGSPSIEITRIPSAAAGGPARMDTIGGKVKGRRGGQRVVVYAKSKTWWVQPFSHRPFTGIREDSTWESRTHLGTEYAALLVDGRYVPAKTTETLPAPGNGVLAVVTAQGRPMVDAPAVTPKMIRFSGYEWEVLQLPTDSAGVMHINSPENVSVDAAGALHLRIVRRAGEWTCSEVILQRSLGYGTYSFHVRRVTPFDAATVLDMFTWDDSEGGQNHREMDIEISRWGDPGIKSGQFVIQPYYVPANVFRFPAAEGAAVHSFQWEPGRVAFESAKAAHVFTSGVPTPGNERVHINLYVYGKSRIPQQRSVEVVVDKFEYLP